ncbi:hypothetical protein DBR23_24720 [Acidovorax sp. HMWF018]|nr:hypothetical protein DBR23_24720 [Acidovorax sp. HMWF018]
MTMTSNYDKYIRPEVWPVSVDTVSSVHFGARHSGGRIEVRAWGSPPGMPPRLYVLDVVPEYEAPHAVQAIAEYVMACRKLVG